jgi:hypothetical protein
MERLTELEGELDYILTLFLLIGKRCFSDPHHLRFQEELQVVSQQLRDLKGRLVEEGDLDLSLLEAPQNELVRLYNLMFHSWRAYMNPRLPTLTERLRLADQFIPWQESLDALALLHQELLKFEEQPPNTPEALERVDVLLKTLQDTLEINWKFTEAVADFLRNIQNGRATLADITPDVMDWLWEHKLLEKFSITRNELEGQA